MPLPDALKLFSEYPSFHQLSWFQRTKSFSVGLREKQTFIQMPCLHFFHEQAPISSTLQRKIPPTKPFEEGRKYSLLEKSLEKQMSKGVQSIPAAISDAMIDDSKYLGYS